MTLSTLLRRAAVAAVGALVLSAVPLSSAHAAAAILTFTAPAPGLVSGTVDVALEGTADTDTADAPDAVWIYVDDASLAGSPIATLDCLLGPECSVTGQTASAAWSWDTTTLPDGPHELTARLMQMGAELAHTDALTLTVDNQVASVSITSPSSGTTVAGSAVAVGLAVVDDPEVPGSRVVQLRVDGTPVGSPVACPAGTCGSVSWDSTTTTDGSHALTVELVGGLTSLATSAPVPVVVDNTPASLSITSPAPGSAVAGSTVVVALAVVDDPEVAGSRTVQLRVDGNPVGSPVACAASCAPLTWNSTISSEGSHALTVELLAGVTSLATSAPVLVVVNNHRASVTITSPTAATAVTGSTVAVTVSAVGDPEVDAGALTVRLAVDGVPVGSPVACPAGACGSLSWDSTVESDGPHALTAELFAGTTSLASSPTVTVDVNNLSAFAAVAPPGVVIGVTVIGVSGRADPGTSDVATGVRLYVDGAEVGSASCVPVAPTCAATVVWDATVVPAGGHVLSAVLLSGSVVLAASAAVGITVSNPPPTVAIVSPAASAVVAGTATVIVSAATDVRRSDVPTAVTLLVDSVVVATASCPAVSHTCVLGLTWNAARYAGGHTLAAGVRTTAGAAAASALVPVLAASAARVTLVQPATVVSGTRVLLRGRVVAATTGAPVPGTAVRVALAPVGRASGAVIVTTDARGSWSVSLTARTVTAVSAVTVATRWLSSGRAGTVVRVSAPMLCSLTRTTLTRGAVGKGACRIAGLPRGTGLALRYVTGGRTFTLAVGKAKGTSIPFSFVFPRRGTYLVRVDLAASRSFVAGSSRPMRVVVR